MAASLDLPNFEPCDHLEYLMMIKEANRAHEGICKIRAIALPPSPRTDGYSELIGDLFEDVLGSLTSLLSKLKTSSSTEWYSHMKRRRLDSWNILTTIPYYDGYEWRKYGQKKIRSSKFPRSYYRCAHHKEQDCPATKVVQQKDEKNDIPKFEVTYNMQHTCKYVGKNSLSAAKHSPNNESLRSDQEKRELSSAHQNENNDELVFFRELELEELLSSSCADVLPTAHENVTPVTVTSPWDFSIDCNDIDTLRLIVSDVVNPMDELGDL